MNYKLVFRITGRTLLIESAAMAIPLLIALFCHEPVMPFLLSVLITLVPALLLSRIHAKDSFYAREGFFSVAFIWILFCLFGALPFGFSGYFKNFIDCLFESASGFSTTGATILTDVESLPKSILFWRAFTHWLGGMGVLVFTLAVLPAAGNQAQRFVEAESPGPIVSKLVPKTTQSSKILYAIYLGLTVLEILILRIAGMPWFDSITNSLSTAGTGGFSNRAASIASYGVPAWEIIIATFMLIFAVNFTFFFLLLRQWKNAFRMEEVRAFIIIVAAAVLLIAFNILPDCGSFGESLRLAYFQVTSIISTTGFSTADFSLWPAFSQAVLVILMIIGACAGSTGGGVKVSRLLLAFRCVKRELRRTVHPKSVSVVKLEGKVVSETALHTTMVFLLTFFSLLFGATLLVSLDDFSFTTSFTAVLACLSNIGPGLDAVGPMCDFSIFSAPIKLLLSVCMIAGRLEIFPLLVLIRTPFKKEL